MKKAGIFDKRKICFGVLMILFVVVFTGCGTGESWAEKREAKEREKIRYKMEQTRREGIKRNCLEFAKGDIDVIFVKHEQLTIEDCGNDENIFSLMQETKGDLGRGRNKNGISGWMVNYNEDSILYDAIKNKCDEMYSEIPWEEASVYALDVAGRIVTRYINLDLLGDLMAEKSMEEIVEEIASDTVEFVYKFYLEQPYGEKLTFEKYNEMRVAPEYEKRIAFDDESNEYVEMELEDEVIAIKAIDDSSESISNNGENTVVNNGSGINNTDNERNNADTKNSDIQEERLIKVEKIILRCSDSYIDEKDLEDFSADDCWYIRNGIYALEGRKFSNEKLTEYFNQFNWYNPIIEPEDFTDSLLNEFEISNRDKIVNFEKNNGYSR